MAKISNKPEQEVDEDGRWEKETDVDRKTFEREMMLKFQASRVYVYPKVEARPLPTLCLPRHLA